MRIPPLSAVRCFESVARHASVTLAARELCVTAGAVSQQVRKLEDFVGRALFERTRRGLILTPDGEDYWHACQEALRLLGLATTRLLEKERRCIRVSCTPTFAAQWLVPRLQAFLDVSPEADVQISASNRAADLQRGEVHFAVRHGVGPYPGLRAELLLADDLIPVCSPRLVAPRRTAVVSDITSARLLHDEHRGDWRLWLAAAGLQGVDAERGIVFADSNAVVQAALAGHGVALVRSAFVQAELAERQLVAVKAPSLQSPLAYRLVYLPEVLIDPALRQFREWLMAQRPPQA